MTVWILLVFFNYSYAGGSTSIEFQSQATCEAAAKHLNDKWVAAGWPPSHVFTVCVQK